MKLPGANGGNCFFHVLNCNTAQSVSTVKTALAMLAGKGTYKWKSNGAIYDGDWKCGQRCGYGTYSVPADGGGYQKQYSGGWKNDKRHVR